ncbi:MAG TPA: sigma-E factor negative regulatory protein [Gammaproteobacteria bacterium]|nr:sigma-E factor negative regulatory protein [Gammaproteobacteria bacterium]
MSKMQDFSESVSSFMDGELGDHSAVLDKLKNCKETKACWLRYHMIRDTLRDSRPVNLSADFSSRVMNALASEPLIINPRFSRYRASFRRHLFKPAAGLAIAASVAAITVFTMQTFYMPNSQSAFNVAANSATPVYPVATVSSNEPRVDKQDDDLNSYLLEHMEHSGGSVQGVMPYVRLAGFEDSQ